MQCDSDLSFVEYYVLASLSDQPEYTMRMSRLAVLANSELSRLSHLMSRLEKRGFVLREPDPADGRYKAAVGAWAQRLGRAVNSELVTVQQAIGALQREERR